MTLKRVLIFLVALCCVSCSRSVQVVAPGYIGDGDYEPSPAVMELLSEHALISPGGHAYLYMKRGSGTDKPVLDSVADIRLRVFDVSDKLVSEDETQVLLNTAQPLIKDVVRQMVVGDKVRVWGDSYLRVWEVELLDFQTPKSGEILASGPKQPEDADKPWIITKRVKGERLQKDQIVHVQVIQWKDTGDAALEFTKSYDVLLQVNKKILVKYYDMFLEMAVGERARAWHLNNWDPKDAVYDIWVIDRYPQYETPDKLHLMGESGVKHVDFGVSKKLLYRPANAKPIVESPYKSGPFEISMNCWDETSGKLLATSDIHAYGWSGGVRTGFRIESCMELWCDLVDFEKDDAPDWGNDWSGRCEHKPDYEAYEAEYEDLKAKRVPKIVKRRRKGQIYYRSDLTEHWQKIIDDSAYGDVFMVWISHYITYEAAKRRDPDAYEDMRDTVCRVEIGERVPSRDEMK